jgi:hypothetical protein
MISGSSDRRFQSQMRLPGLLAEVPNVVDLTPRTSSSSAQRMYLCCLSPPAHTHTTAHEHTHIHTDTSDTMVINPTYLAQRTRTCTNSQSRSHTHFHPHSHSYPPDPTLHYPTQLETRKAAKETDRAGGLTRGGEQYSHVVGRCKAESPLELSRLAESGMFFLALYTFPVTFPLPPPTPRTHPPTDPQYRAETNRTEQNRTELKDGERGRRRKKKKEQEEALANSSRHGIGGGSS